MADATTSVPPRTGAPPRATVRSAAPAPHAAKDMPMRKMVQSTRPARVDQPRTYAAHIARESMGTPDNTSTRGGECQCPAVSAGATRSSNAGRDLQRTPAAPRTPEGHALSGPLQLGVAAA